MDALPGRGTARFVCPWCSTCTERAHDLGRHIQQICDPNEMFQCSQCGHVFRRQERFVKHQKEKHRRELCDPAYNESAKKPLPMPSRTAFGCGLCEAVFSFNLHRSARDEYARHVAAHYEPGMPGLEWNRQRQIFNLLKQDRILRMWIETKRPMLAPDEKRRPTLSIRDEKMLIDLLEYGHRAQQLSTWLLDRIDLVAGDPSSAGTLYLPLAETFPTYVGFTNVPGQRLSGAGYSDLGEGPSVRPAERGISVPWCAAPPTVRGRFAWEDTQGSADYLRLAVHSQEHYHTDTMHAPWLPLAASGPDYTPSQAAHSMSTPRSMAANNHLEADHLVSSHMCDGSSTASFLIISPQSQSSSPAGRSITAHPDNARSESRDPAWHR